MRDGFCLLLYIYFLEISDLSSSLSPFALIFDLSCGAMSVEETRPILAPDSHEAHNEPKSRGLGKLAIATALFGMFLSTLMRVEKVHKP